MTIKDTDRALLKTIQENTKKLNACPRHDFVDDPTDPRTVWKRQQCTRCGGTTDSLNASWYKRGLEDGALSTNKEENTTHE